MSFVVRLRKESFKFSGSHFTIFSETSAERLHGHNYYVAVDLYVKEISKDLGLAFDFNEIKPSIKKVCDMFDEYVLVPESSPFLKVIKSKSGEVEVTFAKKRYLFPADDVKLLPIANVTSEEMARYFSVELKRLLPKGLPVTALSVTVKETQGQAVTFRVKL